MIQFHQTYEGYSLSFVTRKMAFIWELNYTSVFEKEKCQHIIWTAFGNSDHCEKGGAEVR